MESKLTRQDPNTVGGKVAAKWSGLLGSVRGQSGRAGRGGVGSPSTGPDETGGVCKSGHSIRTGTGHGGLSGRAE